MFSFSTFFFFKQSLFFYFSPSDAVLLWLMVRLLTVPRLILFVLPLLRLSARAIKKVFFCHRTNNKASSDTKCHLCQNSPSKAIIDVSAATHFFLKNTFTVKKNLFLIKKNWTCILFTFFNKSDNECFFKVLK